MEGSWEFNMKNKTQIIFRGREKEFLFDTSSILYEANINRFIAEKQLDIINAGYIILRVEIRDDIASFAKKIGILAIEINSLKGGEKK